MTDKVTPSERVIELRKLASEGRRRITDDDFDRAEMSPAEEESLIELMTARGYSIGMDENHRNEWWPPSDDDQKEQGK